MKIGYIRRNFFKVLSMTLLLSGIALSSWGIEKIKPDQRAVALINHFMKALKISDETQRETTVSQLLHKSMLGSDGRLSPSVKRYSYQKACDGVKFYDFPVRITEVHKGRVVTIGFKETAEKGRIDKYFVGKREGVAGRPAPLHIFWPEDGGKPKLVNIGSL